MNDHFDVMSDAKRTDTRQIWGMAEKLTTELMQEARLNQRNANNKVFAAQIDLLKLFGREMHGLDFVDIVADAEKQLTQQLRGTGAEGMTVILFDNRDQYGDYKAAKANATLTVSSEVVESLRF